MSVVAVVAAVRIQSWISRTTDLYLVRGASEGLSICTSAAAIAPVLHQVAPGVACDADAPDVDGVVVLTGPDEGAARAGVEAVLTHLAEALPGVEWTAWVHEAASYVQAYDHVVTQGRPASGGTWHRPPLGLDVPLGASCEGCAQEVATGAVRRPEKTVRLGPDCMARFRHNTWRRNTTRAADFTDLAVRGGVLPGVREVVVGRRDARNHLATLAADGNRVGDLFKVLATMPAAVQAVVSQALDDAVTAAVTDAASPWRDAEVSPVIVHFTGGDDVLLSVAAPYAWRFATRFAEAFGEVFRDRVAAGVREVELSDRDRDTLTAAAGSVSLGVGLVFSQKAFPFAQARDIAHDAMIEAKRAARGRGSAVSWADLTVEAGAVPGRAIGVGDLVEDLAADPSPASMARRAVLHLNSSARDVLAGILEQGKLLNVDPQVVGEHVQQWSLRTGHPMDSDDSTPWDTTRIATLTGLVDRARWWPVTGPVGADQGQEPA